MSVHVRVDATLGYLLWYCMISCFFVDVQWLLRAMTYPSGAITFPSTAVAGSIFVIIQYVYETWAELSLIGDFVLLSINRCLHYSSYAEFNEGKKSHALQAISTCLYVLK